MLREVTLFVALKVNEAWSSTSSGSCYQVMSPSNSELSDPPHYSVVRSQSLLMWPALVLRVVGTVVMVIFVVMGVYTIMR